MWTILNFHAWVGQSIGTLHAIEGYLPPWHDIKSPYDYLILQNDLFYSTLSLVILSKLLHNLIFSIAYNVFLDSKVCTLEKCHKLSWQPKGTIHTWIAILKITCFQLFIVYSKKLSLSNCVCLPKLRLHCYRGRLAMTCEQWAITWDTS